MLSASHFLFYIIPKTLYQIDINIISISQMKKLKVIELTINGTSRITEPFIGEAEMIAQVL